MSHLHSTSQLIGYFFPLTPRHSPLGYHTPFPSANLTSSQSPATPLLTPSPLSPPNPTHHVPTKPFPPNIKFQANQTTYFKPGPNHYTSIHLAPGTAPGSPGTTRGTAPSSPGTKTGSYTTFTALGGISGREFSQRHYISTRSCTLYILHFIIPNPKSKVTSGVIITSHTNLTQFKGKSHTPLQ